MGFGVAEQVEAFDGFGSVSITQVDHLLCVAAVERSRHAQGGTGIVGIEVSRTCYKVETAVGLVVGPFHGAGFVVGVEVVIVLNHASCGTS